MVDGPPAGLNPPPWWQAAVRDFQPSGEREASGWDLPPDGGTGGVVAGAALASAGVMAATFHPEHALLYRVDALD